MNGAQCAIRRVVARSFLLLLLTAVLPAQFRPWYSYFNFNFGPKALGMGNAFTAVADDLTAAYWNPAGLAEVKAPVFYLSYRSNRNTFRYDTELRIRNRHDETYNFFLDTHLNHIDYFSVAIPARFWHLKWSFSFSYCPYIMYGFRGYSEGNFISTNPDNPSRNTKWNMGGAEGNDVLAFSAAFRLGRVLAVGATVQQFFNTGTTQYQYEWDDVFYDNNFSERLSGRNLILGILITPIRQVRLGFAYHSGLQGKLTSAFTGRVVAAGQEVLSEDSRLADVTIPRQYSFGLALRPVRFLTLSAERSTILWSEGRIANYYGTTAALPYPVRSDFTFPQQDIINLRFGLEAAIPLRTGALRLRTGFFADRQLFLDQKDTQVTLHGYSLGFGIDVSPSLLLEGGVLRQQASWPERGNLKPKETIGSHFISTSLTLGITYSLKKEESRQPAWMLP